MNRVKEASDDAYFKSALKRSIGKQTFEQKAPRNTHYYYTEGRQLNRNYEDMAPFEDPSIEYGKLRRLRNPVQKPWNPRYYG